MKRIIGYLFVMMVSGGMDAVAPKKPWTFFVYMAADNDLNQFVQMNLEQMMAAGSTADRNIVVYLAEKEKGIKYGKKIVISKGSMQVVGREIDVDSGSREIFRSACEWAIKEYPADHYAIIGWDHGSGPLNRVFRGVAYDFSTGHYLSDVDVIEVCRYVSQNLLGGKKLDILGFDACLMAGIELQAPLSPYVSYFVASQETIPGYGWNYALAVRPLTASVSPRDYARFLVSAYRDTYKGRTNDYTLSAVDLSVSIEVARLMNQIATILSQILDVQQGMSAVDFITKATSRRYVTCFGVPEREYLDIDDLCSLLAYFKTMVRFNVSDNRGQVLLQQLSDSVYKAREACGRAVIAKEAGPSYPRAQGISIYWGRKAIHPSYPRLIFSRIYSEWANVIRKYLSYF